MHPAICNAFCCARGAAYFALPLPSSLLRAMLRALLHTMPRALSNLHYSYLPEVVAFPKVRLDVYLILFSLLLCCYSLYWHDCSEVLLLTELALEK